MYRGNAPGQFNGNRMPAGKEYNMAYGMPHPNQPQMRGQAMQGHVVQRFQNQSYGTPTTQVQYRAPQAAGYPTDPYGYSSSKIVGDIPQSFSGVSQTTMSSGHNYGVSGMQVRPTSAYPAGSGTEVSVASDSGVGMQQYRQAKPQPQGWAAKPTSDMNMMQYGQGDPTASRVYNGSQFMSGVAGMQPGSAQAQPDPNSTHLRHPMQSSSYVESKSGSSLGSSAQPYQGQMSSMSSQFQQRPGTSSTTPSSMYMQQQYMSQTRNSFVGQQAQLSSEMQQGAKMPGQFDESQMLVQQQQQNVVHQQAAMKQGQIYRPKAPSSVGSLPQPGHPQQQLMGIPSNPLQQAMSPRHNSPLSPPMRGAMVSRPSVPPASPQMQVARTTPQYPTAQASPLHQANPMSPTSRLSSYSPRQQMSSGYMMQGQMPSGYRPNVTPSRVPAPRNEQSNRGFMSPPRMMSPPPASPSQNISHSQSNRTPTPFNGDASMQQYYNRTGRYPPSWQGSKPQTATGGRTVLSSPANMTRQPVMQQMQRPMYGAPQQQQQHLQQSFNNSQFNQISNVNSSNENNFQQTLSTPSATPSRRSSILPPATPTSTALTAPSDFDADFNLDSILSDAMDTTGSFMQQLQEVVPSSAATLVDPMKLSPVPQSSSNAVPAVVGAEADTAKPSRQLVSQTQPPSMQVTNNTTVVNTSTPIKNTYNSILESNHNSSGDSKLDSGEITLETTEQDLLKTTSDITIPLTETDSANLPAPPDNFTNELSESEKTMLGPTVSQSPSITPQPLIPNSATSTGLANENADLLSPIKSMSSEASTSEKLDLVSGLSADMINNSSANAPAAIGQGMVTQPTALPSSLSGSFLQGVLPSSTLASHTGSMSTNQLTSGPSDHSSVGAGRRISMGPPVQVSTRPDGQPSSVRPMSQHILTQNDLPRPQAVGTAGQRNTVPAGQQSVITGDQQNSMFGSQPSVVANVPPGLTTGGQLAAAQDGQQSMTPDCPPSLGGSSVASGVGSVGQPGNGSSGLSGPMQGGHPTSTPSSVYSAPTPSTHLSHHGQPHGMLRPRTAGEGAYGPVHQNRMGMPPRIPQSSGSQVPRMHAHDGSVVRQLGPHPYPPHMHPRYQQHPHPSYGYGSRPQGATGPYPAASATPQHARPPYGQGGPRVPRGSHPGFMGGRPAYQPLHPSQQQHLQQQLQGLRHEAQQLQGQLQCAQQEEAETKPDPSIPMEQPPRSEQIRGRLIDIDRSIKQIMMQLHGAQSHHGPPPQAMQDPNHPLGPHSLGPEYLQDGENTSKSADDSLATGGKKKRARKPKTKSEGEDGKKPPKKKKKKDVDSELATGEKKKKKKVKKDKILSGFTDTDTMDGADGDSNDKANLDVTSEPFRKDEDASADDFLAEIEDGEISNKIQDKSKKVERKKKRPVATVVKPKKKRKRGYDSSDEMNATDILQSTPPPSPEDSLIEKRRSGRNVKRKRYVESVDLPFSGGEDDSDTQMREPKKSQQIVELNEMTEAEDVMIVDKILSHRKRKRKVKCRSESKEGTQKTGDSFTEETEIPSIPKESDATEIDVVTAPTPDDAKPETEHIEGQNGPMLSPTSLKNPRIRKFSMGVDKEEEEEVEDEKAEDEYYIKYKNYSYLHCDWKTKDEIEDKRFDQKLKRYIAKNTSKSGQLIYPELEADELFNPDFVEVDRVLDVTNTDGDGGNETRHFLVKWCSLAYEDSTWEREDDIEKVKIEEFENRCRYRPPRRISRPPKDAWKRLSEGSTLFCNNNLLRDYQFEGINWLLFNWYNRRNCILADEMGLGKTIQSITFLQKIYDHGIQGPFLVVAPLSTIANWQREFESWTTINAIVYHGSQTSRDMLHTYEWFCRDENLDEIQGAYKMHAVITTYEMIVLDSPHLRDVEWKCLIIDEGHRLKNHTCKLADSLRNMHLDHKVLLTGTPLQNNVEELFALLSFLQPDTFNCQQAFSLEFGNLKDNAQVEKLQELLKPMMLRRLKEDVEKSLAPKQETIIEVELTNIQKKYYRAILERNFEFLAKGTSGGNVPNLMNTMMELRKCCNHPYLIKGAEDKITQEQRSLNKEFNALQAMIQSSGKLVLIDKLLPRLKEGGHKVLVFSQMVRVLDILEDYLVQSGHLYERIDGCIRGNERQMAIDRFSKKGSDRFVFLLCTRAGGLGINLTAADTVIIFDSDWNPQNDLQAQARCHRIGQQKPVKVYRLITRNSYEREMFDKASLKLGLDKAVLQSISGRQDQVTNQPQAPQLSKREVEDLLKRGAYGAVMDDDDAGSKFCEEDIDQILDRRAHIVTLESGEKGSTFSKASFVSAEDRPDISLDDPNFWEKWAKKADLDIDRLNDNKLILEIPRNRKQTRRFGGNSDDKEIFAEIGSDSDDSAEYDSDGAEGQGRRSKFRTRAGGPGGGQRKGWGRRDCFRIEKCLLTFGWGRWSVIQQRGRFVGTISATELEDMARAVLMYCLKYYNGDDKIRLFIWDLITPEEIAKKTGIDLRNHEGLATPVPRGRKGKRNKDDPEKPPDEQSKREWAKVINLDSFLSDEGFKKHIQHQCNKVILRVRMLYYLRTEILNNITAAVDGGAKHDEIEFEVVDKLSDAPAAWWDAACDKSLLIGIYKHGYEKYNLIRADNLLCFLDKAGPPDERALAAEMDVEPDGDESGDPEYKPTRITFNEIEFGQDSPAPGTPNTEPASPASADVAKKKDDDKGAADSAPAEPKKKEPAVGKDWPSVSDLNTRLRRLITVYQKHYKQIQQRLMNLERRSARSRYSDNSRLDMKRMVQQSRWTRREEADFYRTVSTFGIERDPRSGDFTWRRFRNIARLDRKTDESLRMYYLAFRHMCEQVCRWTDKPGTGDGTGIGLDEEIPNIDVDPITEERASRTLYRIRLLDKVRSNVLVHPKLKERLKLCQRSAEMPLWWQHGVHDYELLVAMDKHGVTRTEIHTLNDPSLTFLKAMREYEADPLAMKQKILSEEKAELESKMKNMKEQQEAREASIKMELTESKESLKKDAESKRVKQEEEKTEADEKHEDPIDEKHVDEEDSKEERSIDDKVKEKAEESMEVDEQKAVSKSDDADKGSKSDDAHKGSKSDDADKGLKSDDADKGSKSDEETKSSGEDVKDEKEENKKDASTIEASEEKDASTIEACEEKDKEAADAKDTKEDETTTEKQENPVEDKPQEKVSDANQDDEVRGDESKPPASSDVKPPEDVKEEEEGGGIPGTHNGSDIKRALQMSLRSKNSQPMLTQSPPIPQDIYNAITSNYSGLHHMSPFAINSMNGRWPKDRTLIQRVEQVCYCVINGEWPHTNQSLLPAMSNPTDTASGGFSSSRSQSSTPLSEGRGTPILPSHSSALPNAGHDIGNIPGHDKQLQAAMAQLLASNDSNPRSPYPSRRGRRKKRTDHHTPTSGSPSISFSNQSLPPLDKSLQRKIEQLMAGGNQSFPASSSAAGVFASQSPRSELTLSKSSMKPSTADLDNGSGNSSASLLANLRELAKADTKSEQSSSRSRNRPLSGYPHHHSPSPQSRHKDNTKSSSDLLKTSQSQQFMPTPEQIMALTNPSMQQLMQDAAKRGIDPVSAMAAMFPMFPMVDPYQSINASKADTLPQIPAHLSLPPPAEMEKVLKSMGLPSELAMMPDMWPGLLMPPTSQNKHDQPKDSESRQDTSSKLSDTSPSILSSSRSDEKRISSLVPDRPSSSKKRGVSKLDTMFGLGKPSEESPGKSSGSGKKSRKSKFVSPAMLPSDTRIPVHNSNEGVRLSGKNAPLNKDLADWLQENQGFVVDYQALRQQLDDNGSKKEGSEGEGDRASSGPTSSTPLAEESKQKDIFDEAAALLKNAKKLVEPHKSEPLEGSNESNRTRDKSKQSDFAVPNPVPSTSPAMSRSSGTPTSSSLKQQQQQLTDMALLQMNAAAAAGLTDPAAAALFSLPPDILNNLANMPPDVAALIAGGFLPGAMNPDMLAGATGLKPPSRSDDKRRSDSSSPIQSATSSRSPPPQRRHDKNPPTDAGQLTGDERVTVVNITTGKKLSGRQAPELQTLADYLRSHSDVVVSPDWSTVIRKSKFLPKNLHTRLTPARPSSPDKYSASSSHQMSSSLSSNAAMAAALGGLPPAMFPGLLQGQGMMSDPMQMMAALQQMPGAQGQMDMKALAASGFPMFPFLGGFPGQDAAAVAAMAALSQAPPPAAKKDQRSSGQDRSSSDGNRGRKSKKHNERHGERSGHRSSSTSSTSFKPQTSQSSLPADPMVEALAALQQTGGLSSLSNPFLAGAGGANPMMFPPMMMGGQGGMFPMDMMNPELIAAQLAAFGGVPNIDPPKLPSSSASTSTQKREKRRGSSSSSSVSHKPTSSGRSLSRGATDEQPMDLTQFAGGSSTGKDRQTPDKHKH